MTAGSFPSVENSFGFGAVLATCAALLLGQPVLAQEGVQSAPPPQTAPTPPSSPYELVLRTGAGCDGGRRNVSGSISPSCPFAATAAGLKIAPRIDLPDGDLIVRLGFARGGNAPLSLDRQLLRTAPAVAREGTALAIGGGATLLGGKLRIESDLFWSRSWSRGLADSPLLLVRRDRQVGFSQRHAAHFTAIELPGLKWKLEATVARASEAFSSETFASIGTQVMNSGDMDRVASKLQIGGARLNASLAGMRTPASRRTVRTVSMNFAGMTAALSDRTGHISRAQQFNGGPARSRSRSLSFDLDFDSLVPMPAVQVQGREWRALVPRQVTVRFDRRHVVRPESTLRPDDRRRSVEITGMWTSPLGDTLVDYSRDRTSGHAGRIERGDQLLVTHSFEISHWSVSLDLASFRTRAADRDNDAMFSCGASISRKFADGARLAIKFGSDAQSFGGATSDFSFRDASRSAKLELDLSTPLRKRFDNPSIRLSLAAQARLDYSDYRLRFPDEVLDENAERYARQGFLASFGYTF